MANERCYAVADNLYYEDTLQMCVAFQEIEGLQPFDGDQVRINADYRILDDEGNPLRVGKEVFGPTGQESSIDLIDEMYHYDFIVVENKGLKPGNYILELTIFDLISNEFAKVNQEFTISKKQS